MPNSFYQFEKWLRFVLGFPERNTGKNGVELLLDGLKDFVLLMYKPAFVFAAQPKAFHKKLPDKKGY